MYSISSSRDDLGADTGVRHSSVHLQTQRLCPEIRLQRQCGREGDKSIPINVLTEVTVKRVRQKNDFYDLLSKMHSKISDFSADQEHAVQTAATGAGASDPVEDVPVAPAPDGHLANLRPKIPEGPEEQRRRRRRQATATVTGTF